MRKIATISQYIYLVFAGFLAYSAICIYEQDQNKAFLYVGMAALAIFMFFFRKRMTKKYTQ